MIVVVVVGKLGGKGAWSGTIMNTMKMVRKTKKFHTCFLRDWGWYIGSPFTNASNRSCSVEIGGLVVGGPSVAGG